MPELIGGTNGRLNAGVCVGVLYIETDPARIDQRFCRYYNGRWYCVHNGRLVQNYSSNETQILVNHKIWGRFSNQIVEEQRLLSNVISVGRIRGTSPCQSARRSQPAQDTQTLRPDWCGGVAYREGSRIRVSNGKYMYYITPQGNRRCLLQNRALPANITVYYRHYNIFNDRPGRPYIREELATPRTNVVAVESTSRQ